MAEYALFKDGVLQEYRFYDTPPPVATHKGYALYEVIRTTNDTSTQPYIDTVINETVDANASQYIVETVITDKIQVEIDAIIEAEKDLAVQRIDEERDIVKALGLVVFDLTNEVRVLKSQSTITLTQFKNYLKGKL